MAPNIFPEDGNVGIGTTDPGSPNIGAAPVLNIEGADPGIRLRKGGGGENTILTDDGNLRFLAGPSSEDSTEVMRITSTGNVGIGTTSPEEKLHVQEGGVLIEGVQTAPTLSLVHKESRGDIKMGNDLVVSSSGSIGLAANQGEGQPRFPQIIIHPDGHVGVQNELDVDDHISLSSKTNQPRLRFLNDESHEILAEVYMDQVTEKSGELRFCTTSEAGDLRQQMTIRRNGSVGIGVAEPNRTLHVEGFARFSGAIIALGFDEPSDQRLKSDIVQLDGVLDRLSSLRGVAFKWAHPDGPEAHEGQNSIGVIAQEVEQVFPELVSDDESTGFKVVNYGRLAAVLLEAIKELKAENDELGCRLTALESV